MYLFIVEQELHFEVVFIICGMLKRYVVSEIVFLVNNH